VEKFSVVESVQNSMVKHAHSLTVSKKLRESEDFLCEGFHLVGEALASGLKLRFILATDAAEARPEGRDLAQRAAREKVRWVKTVDRVIHYLSETASPQGLVAVVKKPETRWPIEPLGLILGVHGVQDPGNIGSMFRTAEAAGVSGVFFTGGLLRPLQPQGRARLHGLAFPCALQDRPDLGGGPRLVQGTRDPKRRLDASGGEDPSGDRSGSVGFLGRRRR